MLKLILLISIIIISSCSKQAQQTQAKLEISSSFIVSGQPGGTMLYLINKDAQTQQAMAVDSNQLEVTLTNGNWDFAVLSWSGPDNKKLEGILRCAKASANLIGGIESVSLNLTQSACHDNYFSPYDFRSQVPANSLQIHSCNSISTATANGVCNGEDRGEAKSYKFILLSHKEASFDGNYDESILGNSHITSECLAADDETTGLTNVPHVIPFGGPSFGPAIAIQTFANANCTGSQRDYFFPRGLSEDSIEESDTKIFSYETKANLYLNNGKIQIEEPSNFGNFALGSTSSSIPVTITNFSERPALINSIVILGDFSRSGGSCAQNTYLNPGNQCTVGVVFNPSEMGVREGELKFTYNNGYSQTETVNLTGTGVSTVTASAINNNVNLSWSPVGGATSYRLYRSTSSGSFLSIHADNISTTSYVDSASITLGTQYFYLIRPLDGTNEMSPLPEVTVRPIAPPTGIGFNILGNGQITTYWSGVTGATSYDLIYESASVSGTWENAPNPATLSTLSDNTTYNFKVRAKNNIGGGAISDSAFYTQISSPTTPTNVLATTSNGLNTVSWTPVPGILGYYIYRSNSSGSYLDTPTYVSGSASSSWVDLNSSPGTQLYYKVRAFNNVMSEYSSEVSSKAIGAVAAPTISTVSINSITVSWAAVTGADQYQILYGTTTDSTTSLPVVNSGITSATINNLSPGTNYQIRIRALNSIGTGASSTSTPLAVSTSIPAQLTLSNASIVFTNALVGTTESVSVVVTNSSPVTQATAINFSITGTNSNLFSVVPVSCSTTLPATNTCMFNISFTPLTSGSSSASLIYSYNNGGNTINASIPLSGNNSIATGSMSAYYSNASNWSTYASSSSTFGVRSASVCSPTTDMECQHGGELRYTSLPAEFTSCTDLVGSDSLQAFNWECVVENGSVVFRSKGLVKNKGLKDLVNSTSWKPNQFFAKIGTTTVYQTPITSWWSNPIYNINILDGAQIGSTGLPPFSSFGVQVYPLSGGLQIFELNVQNAVYTVTSDISVAGLRIANSNISLVSIPTSGVMPIISTSNTSANNCNATNGGSASPDSKVVICAGDAGSNHSWIEVKATGINTAGGIGILSVAPAFSRIHLAEMDTSETGIRLKGGTKPNKVLYSKISNTSSVGLKIESDKVSVFESQFFGNGIGVHFYGANGGTLGGSKVVHGSGAGVKVENSSFTRVHNNIIAFNAAQGALYDTNSGTGHKFHDNLLSSNCTYAVNNSAGALEIGQTTDSYFFNFLSVHNNCHGLKVNTANATNHQNTFRNATIVSNYKGIDLYNTNKNTFVDVVSSHNSGYSTSPNWAIVSSNYNNFINIVATNSDYGLSFNNSNNNEFTNSLLLGGTYPCSFSNSTISFPPATASASCTSSIVNSSTDLSSTFIGKVTTDAKNIHNSNLLSGMLYTGVSDFINFENPFRYWGHNTGTTPGPFIAGNDSMCSSSDGCAIWDWRLKSLDSEIINRTENGNNTNDSFVPSASCPDILEGSDYVQDLMTTSNKFLLHATEINFDGFGDDDGLCESSESCTYAPNYGYYQGEGNLTGACTFTGGLNTGDLTAITIKAFSVNGI
jgi:Fibronectin type III domain/Right handed beta helix region